MRKFAAIALLLALLVSGCGGEARQAAESAPPGEIVESYAGTAVTVAPMEPGEEAALLLKNVSAASGAEPDGEIIAFRRSAVIRALASVCFPATVMPAAAFGALAYDFASDLVMACIISFAFAVFACVLAYALMYSRDFFG